MLKQVHPKEVHLVVKHIEYMFRDVLKKQNQIHQELNKLDLVVVG